MRKGLTLVELLLVVGILALLFGIVYTITSSVRKKAKIVACMSNLKQIGVAIKLYREDWGGRPPRRGLSVAYWTNPESWTRLGLPPGDFALVNSGYADKRVFRCPAASLELSPHIEEPSGKRRPWITDYHYLPEVFFVKVIPTVPEEIGEESEKSLEKAKKFLARQMAREGDKVFIMDCLNHNPSKEVCLNPPGTFDVFHLVLRLDGSVTTVLSDMCSFAFSTKIHERGEVE